MNWRLINSGARIAGRGALALLLVALVTMGLRHNPLLTGTSALLLVMAVLLRVRIRHASKRERARFHHWIFDRPELSKLRRLARRTKAPLGPPGDS